MAFLFILSYKFSTKTRTSFKRSHKHTKAESGIIELQTFQLFCRGPSLQLIRL